MAMEKKHLEAFAGADGGRSRCGVERHQVCRDTPNNEVSNRIVTQDVAEVLRSAGQPLDSTTRKMMERLFGYDFSMVRVHTGMSAVRSARTLNALAYTVGRHVVFNAGQYDPESTAGRSLLAHELAHAIQQDQVIEIDFPNLTVGPVDDLYERQARSIGKAIAAIERKSLGSRPIEQTIRAVRALMGSALKTRAMICRQNASERCDHTPPPGVCGPNVTREVANVWSRMQADFRGLTSDQKDQACSRTFFAFDFSSFRFEQDNFDVLPLFLSCSRWLRRWPVFDAATGGPCATPSSSRPSAPARDPAHEDPCTCSDTVQVGNQCWLNGTVNYGTYGIMARLCHDEFPIRYGLARQMGETTIRVFKTMVADPREDPTLPIAWFLATFDGGPSGKPSNPGNRPQCTTTCPLTGSVTTWDYVWEPHKPRSSTRCAPIPVKPTPPPTPTPPTPTPTGPHTYTVVHGDTLSKIAQKVYGNASLWTKIYNANKSVVGANPNLIFPGQKLTIPP